MKNKFHIFYLVFFSIFFTKSFAENIIITAKNISLDKNDNTSIFQDEVIKNNLETSLIGFTGGEPFMNPDIIKILKYVLNSGFNTLVLTNGMRPIKLKFQDILNLPFLNKMKIRVSIDHFLKPLHEKIRGINTWDSFHHKQKYF